LGNRSVRQITSRPTGQQEIDDEVNSEVVDKFIIILNVADEGSTMRSVLRSTPRSPISVLRSLTGELTPSSTLVGDVVNSEVVNVHSKVADGFIMILNIADEVTT
jgi:hypothetical protein